MFLKSSLIILICFGFIHCFPQIEEEIKTSPNESPDDVKISVNAVCCPNGNRCPRGQVWDPFKKVCVRNSSG